MSDTLITQIVQQTETLPTNLQRQVLDYVKKLTALAQHGIPGEKLLRFGGVIPADDLQLIGRAIEDDCGQVDWHDW